MSPWARRERIPWEMHNKIHVITAVIGYSEAWGENRKPVCRDEERPVMGAFR